MAGSFLFYDFETDGQSPIHCRPWQFAAIRTDMDLHPAGDETIHWCRPAVDRLPAPEACLVTGLTPQEVDARGLTEVDFFTTIRAILSKPNTTSLGWNSLRFDDVVCRFGFWRTFQEPYAHGYKKGCECWDLIDLARAARALRPTGINWPERAPGVPSFKLEHLAPANDIEHGDAHDAMADVRATIEFGRRLRQGQPNLWTWARSLQNQTLVKGYLTADAPFVHVSAMIPAELGCTSPFRVLASHPTNNKSFLAWDLRIDPSEFLDADTDEIVRRTFSSKTELGDTSRFPIKEIRSNRSPFVAPLSVLQGADRDLLKLDDEAWQRHDAQLRLSSSDRSRLVQRLHAAFQPPSRQVDVDEALYAGFVDNSDRQRADRVQQTAPEDLTKLGRGFVDERLAPLLFHFQARNFPKSLHANQQDRWKARCGDRLANPPDAGEFGWPDWSEHVKSLRSEASASDQRILDAVATWGESLATRAGLIPVDCA